MIFRNVATRHGRRSFTAQISKCYVRFATEQINPSSTVQLGPPILERSAAQEHTPESDSVSESNRPVKGLQMVNRWVPDHMKKKGPSDYIVKKTAAIYNTINWNTATLGGIGTPHYTPTRTLVDPPKPEDLTLEMLMAAQAHLGHNTSLWNPMNQRYIYGIRQGIHIISLEETAAHLRRAAKIVEGVCHRGGIVLFVGTKKGQRQAVVKASELSQGCHLFERWQPGTLTNGDQILKACRIKVVDPLDQPVEGFEDKLQEWKALRPDLVVCLNPMENYIMLHECSMNNIPTIGVIDTNADPTWVTYPIPANDDSIRAIQVIAGVLGRAGEAGHQRRLHDALEGKVTWKPPLGLGHPRKQMENMEMKRYQEKLRQVDIAAHRETFVEPIRDPNWREKEKLENE